MITRTSWFLFVLIASLAFTACSSPSVSPTSTPTSLPTAIGVLPTNLPIAPTVPSPTLTETPTPIATIVPTLTLTPTRTATITRRPVATATRPRATATLAFPPDVYVTAIKIDPNPGKSGLAPTITVTFDNTTGKAQSYRWYVKIYEKDRPQSFGETSKADSLIPVGTSQFVSVSDWKTTAVAPECSFYIARVFWLDPNNQVVEFLKPNGSSTATGFNVCPFP